ncbi:glycosyltransferase [Kocuria rhizophila]|nr:glycosyl transferase family 1 [Kocuria rhizophila]RLP61112.1 glycosyltransferase [Kocuria rhizophila]
MCHRTGCWSEPPPGCADGPRGLLSRAGDPKSLADALQRLIEDPELRVAQGQAGRLWVVDERQWRYLGHDIRHVHERADEHHRALASHGQSLEQLRIGVIADEFTTETIRRSATVVPLDPVDFPRQLSDEHLDLVFVESAWSGNGGQWHRGVGHYSNEEHAPLRDLLARCRAEGIPSVFWNKEDPVHIERFRVTGALCDHVFTTDADMIPAYLHEARHLEGAGAVTASSLPFYAQPAIHNPLPGRRPVEETVAYAGTYYGDRYPDRKRQLDNLLGAAAPHGLAIYDRQLAVPDSPYRFPGQYERAVRGALPYDEVIDSYRAHAVNLNVNSVATSPTMFSRRVVEIAACGGVVLSTWSRGIHETFGSAIPSSNDELQRAALLTAWTSNPEERLREVWLQLRTVLRSHTVETALVVLARTAGLVVDGFQLPAWGATARPAQVPAILKQSVRPVAVHLVEDDAAARRSLESHGIRVTSGVQDRPSVDFWAHLPEAAGRTWAEDLLQATRWGHWDKISAHEPGLGQGSRHVAVPGENVVDEFGMARSALLPMENPQDFRELVTPLTLTVTRPREEASEPLHSVRCSDSDGREQQPRVLVAGHDLKFAASWIEHLRERGVPVLVDMWNDHAHHDEQESLVLLGQADTVFCEWGLGNAVWYSQHVSDGQRLVVRVHAQEIRGPYLKRIQHGRVSSYLFVSELVKEAAITSHGLPREKCHVVPNIVQCERLRQDKLPGARKTIGFVGLVPQLKRLDRAVDLIEELVRFDPEFRLLIKGKRPEEYSWMLKRDEELAWYHQCYERIDRLNARQQSEVVRFEAHGDDMAQWYRNVGYGVSVSDHESFHLTLPDAAASGAAPVSLDWPGADLIYPREWLVSSVSQMARRIFDLSRDEAQRTQFIGRAGRFVQEAFDESLVHSALDAAARVKESDLP